MARIMRRNAGDMRDPPGRRRRLPGQVKAQQRAVIKRAPLGIDVVTGYHVSHSHLLRRDGHAFQPEHLIAGAQGNVVCPLVRAGHANFTNKRRLILLIGGAKSGPDRLLDAKGVVSRIGKNAGAFRIEVRLRNDIGLIVVPAAVFGFD